MKNCKRICYEWQMNRKGKIVDTTGCKEFVIHHSKPTCKLYGKLKSQVTGQVFYLGRKTK